MSREGNLAKNTVILSIGTLFPKVFSLIVTPVLTSRLTRAEYGQYDLITTIVALLLPAVTLQISSAAFRFLIDQSGNKKECSKIISNIFAFTLVSSLFACLIYFLTVGCKLKLTGILICVYLLTDIFLLTAQQVARGLGKNMVYSISAIVQSVVNMTLTVVLLCFIPDHNYGINGVLVAMIAAAMLSLTLLLTRIKIYNYLKVNYLSVSMLKELLQYSWPMVPNNLSGWVLRLSDRLVITYALGIEANAVYAVANKLPSILTMALNSFNAAWQENASIVKKDSDCGKYFEQIFDHTYRIMLGLCGGLIAATPILFKILIGGDYSDAYTQMPFLYLGMFFSGMAAVLGGVYIAFKQTKSVGLTTVVAAVLNLIIDILLVNYIGIFAGSLSTLAAYLFLLIYRMIDVQKLQKIHFNYHTLLFGMLVLIIMSLIALRRNVVMYLANVLVYLALLYIFDKKIIEEVCRMIIKKMRHL